MDMESMTSMVMSATEAAISAATASMSMDHSGMDHGSMGHGSSGANASAAASSGGGGGHGGMSHTPGTCRISMLWNWFVIDSCFLASSWHVRSAGAFAASCIGVILLVISLEMVRRVQREYDGYLRLLIASRKVACTNCDNGVAGAAAKITTSTSSSSDEHDHKTGHGTHVSTAPIASNGYVSKLAYFKSRKFLGPASTRVKIYQHVIRSFLYMVQFAVAYIVMLLAMYFNGYIIISIYIGAFLGAFVFQWDNLHSEQREPCCG